MLLYYFAYYFTTLVKTMINIFILKKNLADAQLHLILRRFMVHHYGYQDRSCGCYDCPHFTDGGKEAQRVKRLVLDAAAVFLA